MFDAVNREQAPAEEDRHAIGDPLRFGEVVRGDQHRAVLREGPHEAAQLDDLPWIEPVRQRVESGRHFKEALAELFVLNAEQLVRERKQQRRQKRTAR